MNLSGLAGLSAAPGGYNAGVTARQDLVTNALRIKAAQEAIRDAEAQRAAQGGGFDVLSLPGTQQIPQAGQPMPQLPPMPGPQSPMPGQPSVPMAPPTDIRPPGYPNPAASPQPSPAPAGAGAPAPALSAPGPGVGAPAPFTNEASNEPRGQLDVRALAKQVSASMPQADSRTKFLALQQVISTLNPQAQAEAKLQLAEIKAQAERDKITMQGEQKQGLLEQKLEAEKARFDMLAQHQVKLAEMRAASQDALMTQKIDAAAALAKSQQDAMMERIRELQAALDRRSAAGNETKVTVASIQAGAKGAKETRAIEQDKRNFQSLAQDAREIAELVQADPTLVGARGGFRGLAASIGEQTGITQGDPERDALKAKVQLLQENLRSKIFKSKHYSKGAQERFNKLVPSLDRLDNPTAVITGLTALADSLEADADAIQTGAASSGAAAPAAATQAPPTQAPPQARPRIGAVVPGPNGQGKYRITGFDKDGTPLGEKVE